MNQQCNAVVKHQTM